MRPPKFPHYKTNRIPIETKKRLKRKLVLSPIEESLHKSLTEDTLSALVLVLAKVITIQPARKIGRQDW